MGWADRDMAPAARDQGLDWAEAEERAVAELAVAEPGEVAVLVLLEAVARAVPACGNRWPGLAVVVEPEPAAVEGVSVAEVVQVAEDLVAEEQAVVEEQVEVVQVVVVE